MDSPLPPPLISVIVRTKDRPRMLLQALASIAAQTYRPLEVQLINDGGQPPDVEALQRLLGDVTLDLRSVGHSEGRARAANRGIQHARGRYLAFLDDDDEWLPGHLHGLLQALQADGAQAAYAGVEMVSASWSDAEGRFQTHASTLLSRPFSRAELLIGNYIPFNSLLVDAELLRSTGGIDESFDLYEDWDLLIRLSRETPFVHVPAATARYHQWSQSQQINARDSGRIEAATLRIMAKHRDEITPRLLLDYRHLRDAMDQDLRQASDARAAATAAAAQAAAAEHEHQRQVISNLQSTLDARIAEVASVAQLAHARDVHIQHLERTAVASGEKHAAALIARDQHIAALDSQLQAMRATLGWRLLEKLRRARARLLPHGSLCGRAFDLGLRALMLWRREGLRALLSRTGQRSSTAARRLPGLARRARQVQQRHGWRVMFARVHDHLQRGTPFAPPRASTMQAGGERYALWMTRNPIADEAAARAAIERFAFKPLISIVTPVYNVEPQWLHRCIESVRRQHYPHWQLCLHDDASTNAATREALREWQGRDERIRISFGKANGGISAASNAALALAEGEFVALLDNDDELSPDALFEVAALLDRHPDTDMVYGDEDRITLQPDGSTLRHDPFFKPDWSPQLLFACMYTGHLSVYRRSLLQALGGFRSAYDFSQDYDLALRVTERSDRIRHIAKVLYHWRTLPTSAAGGGKEFARASNIAALQDACERRGYAATAEALPHANRVHFQLAARPLVSIIIPTDSRDNLFSCIDLIQRHTDYRPYEIVAVTNSALGRELLARHAGDDTVRLCAYDQPFNFSAKCNEGAAAARGDYLLFYNDDVEAIHGSWLDDMLGVFGRGQVGGVSPKLLYENDTIQYAGMITGVRGLVGTAFHTVPKDSGSYFNFVQSERDVSLLSGACLLMPRAVFDEIGGWDAERTPIMHSDIDLCCRIRERGYAMVYTPFAELRHIGHLSLKETDHLRERRKDKADTYLMKRWGQYLGRDPFHPENLCDLLYHHGERPYRIEIGAQDSALLGARDVLFVSHDLSLSGAPMLLLHLAEHFRRRGLFVAVMSPQDGELGDMLRQRKIPLIIDATLADDPDEQTRKLMAAFDLIVANTIVAWPAVQVGHDSETPVLWLLHESRDGVDIAHADARIERALAMAGDVVFACEATRALYRDFDCGDRGDRFHVMPYGTQALPPMASPAAGEATGGEGLRLVQIGSMERRKGQDLLAEALSHLRPETQAALSVTMIGRPLQPDFVAQVQPRLDALPFVRHLGPLPHEQIAGHIAAADVLLLPSRDEVFPVTIMEAMSLGKPVIATAVGGVAEMIRDGIDGLVVPPEDPAALAAAIERLAADRGLLRRMGESARARFFEQFTIERFGDRLLALIEPLLPPPPAA